MLNNKKIITRLTQLFAISGLSLICSSAFSGTLYSGHYDIVKKSVEDLRVEVFKSPLRSALNNSGSLAVLPGRNLTLLSDRQSIDSNASIFDFPRRESESRGGRISFDADSAIRVKVFHSERGGLFAGKGSRIYRGNDWNGARLMLFPSPDYLALSISSDMPLDLQVAIGNFTLESIPMLNTSLVAPVPLPASVWLFFTVIPFVFNKTLRRRISPRLSSQRPKMSII